MKEKKILQRNKKKIERFFSFFELGIHFARHFLFRYFYPNPEFTASDSSDLFVFIFDNDKHMNIKLNDILMHPNDDEK